MPAEKFGFKPQPQDMTFAQLSLHVATTNYLYCSKIGGIAEPELPKMGDTFHIPTCVSGSCGTSGCATAQGTNVVKESIIVGLVDGSRAEYTATELGVTFDNVPAHTRGVGSYGGDEVPRQERPTPVTSDGQRRKRRRRGRRGGRNRP